MKARDDTLKLPEGWPAPIGDDAYYGLTGEIVEAITPQTEADPANVLISVLIAFGNSIGRKARIMIGRTAHFANEYAAMVGPSSQGRKGTGWNDTLDVFKESDDQNNETWAINCIRGGLSTGEGLIGHFTPPKPDKGEPPKTVDRRLMIVEPEFARTLIVMNRPDNTMSPIFRGAWDSGNLDIMTRSNPLSIRGAHISFIGHITTDDLRKHLTVTERANGFANRILFAMTRRSRVLPFGGRSIDYGEIIPQLTAARLKAQHEIIHLRMSDVFRSLWRERYQRLTVERSGMLGAITSRAAPHVIRLAMIYALLDETLVMKEVHLRAALEVWRYCEDSARYIFGDALGDDTADTIRHELKRGDLTRTQIYRDVFSKNKSSLEITRALDVLQREGLVQSREKGEGRQKTEIWSAVIQND
jgi:hypothetical protein